MNPRARTSAGRGAYRRPARQAARLGWILFWGVAAAAAQPQPATYRGAEVSRTVVPFVFEGDLRELPTAPEWRPGDLIREIPRRHRPPPGGAPAAAPRSGLDPLLQLQQRAPTGEALSTPIVDVAGQSFTGLLPPDSVGDVGTSYYIQAVNADGGSRFTVHSKRDGAVVAGPTALDSLGSGACAAGFGDPLVVYDPLARRWLLSEFARQEVGNHLCVYVSRSGDPVAGGWYAYDFETPEFPDYPKLGVWPDAYYVGTNESSGPAVYALDRAGMLAGGAVAAQRFSVPELAGFGFQALTPADLDGPPPPPGSPGLFLRHHDDEVHDPGANDPGRDVLELWQFRVDWATPANSTLSGPLAIAFGEFDSTLCGLQELGCFPQPGTHVTLDPLREVVMWRLQYRHFGSHEALVGNLVTDADGADRGGVRWFELRRAGSSGWSVFQEGTYSPDAAHRWMGAIAMDGDGNIALGYNVAGDAVFPSLRYTGRLASDAAGALPQAERVLVVGSAANASNRYGDYSAMSVDPVDDCTFWLTGEYNASAVWSTRIGAFRFVSCLGALGIFRDDFESGDLGAWSGSQP